MAKRLLIFWAIVAGGFASAPVHAVDTPGSVTLPPAQVAPGAQIPPGAQVAPTQPATPPQTQPSATQNPTARLIKRHSEGRPVERSHAHPLDERCRPTKDQLDAALQKPGNAHRLFQARLAYNAGNRLCREGHAERGLAEYQRGLSYIQENAHP